MKDLHTAGHLIAADHPDQAEALLQVILDPPDHQALQALQALQAHQAHPVVLQQHAGNNCYSQRLI